MKILSCYGNLEHFGRKVPDGEYVSGGAELTGGEDSACVKLRMDCVAYPYHYCRMFTRDLGAGVILDVGQVDQVLGQHCVSPFWAEPVWGQDEAAVKEAQYLLLRSGREYFFVLPLVNKGFAASAVMKDGYVDISVNFLRAGVQSVEGTVAVVASASDPYEAVRKGFAAAYEKRLIKTPPKRKENGAQLRKEYPEVLNGLGWCTWNAFYHEVTEEKILSKLEEFKRKEIPVKWVLIDDGWSEFEDMKLESIFEDRTKFPQGLKATIQRMKSEYGIEKVGVWHSLTGYWFGVDVADAFGLLDTPQGRCIPAGYEFYAQWHGYLKDQGVDFVKVDCQGNAIEFLMNDETGLAKLSEIMDGLERSAAEHFDFMINCMGMNNINALQHSDSVLIRSSDDFFPDKPEGFYLHVVSNVYNAVFMDELFYCDYDMWWSQHFDAKRSAALRFLSGGPVYVSDEVGKSDSAHMKKFLTADGTFRRPVQALKPTYDCLFGFEKLLKTFTKVDDAYVVAVFSFEDSGDISLSAEDFGENGAYQVTELYSGETFLLGAGESHSIALQERDVAVYCWKSM